MPLQLTAKEAALRTMSRQAAIQQAEIEAAKERARLLREQRQLRAHEKAQQAEIIRASLRGETHVDIRSKLYAPSKLASNGFVVCYVDHALIADYVETQKRETRAERSNTARRLRAQIPGLNESIARSSATLVRAFQDHERFRGIPSTAKQAAKVLRQRLEEYQASDYETGHLFEVTFDSSLFVFKPAENLRGLAQDLERAITTLRRVEAELIQLGLPDPAINLTELTARASQPLERDQRELVAARTRSDYFRVSWDHVTYRATNRSRELPSAACVSWLSSEAGQVFLSKLDSDISAAAENGSHSFTVELEDMDGHWAYLTDDCPPPEHVCSILRMMGYDVCVSRQSAEGTALDVYWTADVVGSA